MPVLRKREGIREDYRGAGPARVIQGSAASVMENQAAASARIARQTAQMMAADAGEEGKAIAKRMEFQLRDDGMPEMPESIKGKAGRLVARAYDATIEDRYVHQMTTAMRAQIQDAENENQYDFEAFVADATSRLERMKEGLPEEMHGAFQQISTGLMADTGSTIGQRNASVQERDRKSQEPALLKDGINSIREKVLAGDYKGGQQHLDAELRRIDMTETHIMTTGQKEEAKDTLRAQWGVAMLISEQDVTGMFASQIQDLQERMASGEDPELNKYFTDANGDVDLVSMKKMQYELNPFISKANEREAAYAKWVKDKANTENVLRGGASGTEPDRRYLSSALADIMDVREPGAPHKRGEMDMTTWIGWSDNEQQEALTIVKDAGFLDKSLEQLGLRLSRSQDPNELTDAFRLLRNLDRSPNSAGQAISLMGDMPERLQTIYHHASALYGDGEPDAETVAEAMTQIDALRDDDWDDNLLAAKMNKSKGFFARSVTGDTARSEMNAKVLGTVFEGVEAPEKHMQAAVTVFENYLRLDHTVDEALQMTANSFKERYVESEFMASADRSFYAPEKHYEEAPLPGDIASFIPAASNKLDRWVGGKLLGALEMAVGTNFIEMVTGYNFEFGAEMIDATQFERLAHAKIVEQMANDPVLSEFYKDKDRGWNFMTGKDGDYKLIADKGAGMPPVYKVLVRGPDGTNQVLGGNDWRLDVREEFERIEDVKVKTEDFTRVLKKRGVDWILTSPDDPRAQEVWKRFAQDIIDGKDTDPMQILEEMGIND